MLPWVDTSYRVHLDIRSHAGAAISLGKGSLYLASTRQNINTKISTEDELVGVDGVMSLVICKRYFFEAQGCEVADNIVYQDNKNTMLLENNRKLLVGNSQNYINIRYFFVTGRIEENTLTVEYCPTSEIPGDFFTKPNQVSLFLKFRERILYLEFSDLSLYNLID